MNDRTYNLFTANHFHMTNATSVLNSKSSSIWTYSLEPMLYNFAIVVQPESTNSLQLCWLSLSYRCLYHVHVNKTSTLFPCFPPLLCQDKLFY